LEKLGKSVIKSKEPVDLGDYSLFGAGNHSTKRIVPKGPQPMAPIGVNFENKEK